ncbi:class I SAM-dependent methyltransferase [Paractinoplanes rhizophilus]|uniref:Class I SAM-dependent methyltransferase n=1 Tax=Paractinoplanes rhizophilus TaxID=1416877 RepID=A0ABW2HJD0_9ACTN
MWELGNYARVAELITDMGRDLVAAAELRPGDRVLDVAAGTGNVAVPAARAGAEVTAVDITPELLDAGRRAAGDLPIKWVEGDATDLPFADGEFDVVLSAVGAMFAAGQEATARELTRVCRPGGLVAMANWTPDGGVGRFFALLARYAPEPPAGPPPTRWGDPAQVGALFAGLPVHTEQRVVEYAFTGTPAELADLYRSSFAPVMATRAALGDDARAAFDRDLVGLLAAENTAPPGGPGRWRFPWLLVRLRVG